MKKIEQELQKRGYVVVKDSEYNKRIVKEAHKTCREMKCRTGGSGIS